jgi:hypothetical protein
VRETPINFTAMPEIQYHDNHLVIENTANHAVVTHTIAPEFVSPSTHGFSDFAGVIVVFGKLVQKLKNSSLPFMAQLPELFHGRRRDINLPGLHPKNRVLFSRPLEKYWVLFVQGEIEPTNTPHVPLKSAQGRPPHSGFWNGWFPRQAWQGGIQGRSEVLQKAWAVSFGSFRYCTSKMTCMTSFLFLFLSISPCLGTSYLTGKAEGWHWYEKQLSQKKNRKEKKVLEGSVSGALQELRTLKAKLENYKARAVMSLTFSHIKAYMTLQKEVLEKALRFYQLFCMAGGLTLGSRPFFGFQPGTRRPSGACRG